MLNCLSPQLGEKAERRLVTFDEAMMAVDKMSADLLLGSNSFFHVALLPLLLWIICYRLHPQEEQIQMRLFLTRVCETSLWTLKQERNGVLNLT